MAADDSYLSFLVARLGVSSGLQRPAVECSAEEPHLDDSTGLPRPAPLIRRLFNSEEVAGDRCLALALQSSASPESALRVVECRSHKRAKVAVSCLPDCRDGHVSLRGQQDAERSRLCELWADVALHLLDASDMEVSSAEIGRVHLLRIFQNRATSTLKKHLAGWHIWWDFCRASSCSVVLPSLPQLLDFFESLYVGAREDRGNNRKGKALGVVAAMKFTASRLQLGVLLGRLRSPLLEPWGHADKWQKRRPREANPLAFEVVEHLEAACLSAPVEDVWLLLCFLLMLFCSLRWSDAQRVDLSSISCQEGCLRGWSWRCKQSATGMPWAVWCRGVTKRNWGIQFYKELTSMRAAFPQKDFLIGSAGRPVSYSTALAHFRRCLVLYGGVATKDVLSFTLHSLKCTFLAWAEEADASSKDRCAQGHHKEPGVNGCVPKYGRNDTLAQLRCQQHVWDKLETGWHPGVPVDRGVGGPIILPSLSLTDQPASAVVNVGDTMERDELHSSGCGVADDEAAVPQQDGSATEAEEEQESEPDEGDDDCSSACPSDGLDGDVDDVDPFDTDNGSGPWIINGRTGWFHFAVRTDSGGLVVNGVRWGLACRPKVQLQPSCFLVSENPALQSYVCCGHSGCASQCKMPE